ncbi:MAG: PglZ domain-containing protein [Bacteroidota bacterium]|nr:PglZ domain-containing protein [Bacteroidota bacterium]
MSAVKILWTDDEIDILKPHIMFLEHKGYEVTTSTNGRDTIDLVNNNHFDIIFLDEMMPGLSGLETLAKIKRIIPDTPVVMITKSEEENIMEDAIGSKISDYLIKPVNPNQILLSIKKNVNTQQLVSQKTISNYQSVFNEISLEISDSSSFSDWVNIYKKLVYWDLELNAQNDKGINEVLKMQMAEANNSFAKFIKNNYTKWFNETSNKPLLSPNLFKDRIFPLLDKGEKVFVLVIDCLRYDQWKTISPLISNYFNIDSEELFCSILPTTTQYARNSIFAGLMPYDINKLYPQLWLNDEDDGGKNLNEEELLEKQINRFGKKYKYNYEKISHFEAGEKIVNKLSNLLTNDLNVLVYNYIDMLSHARTDVDAIKELANDEPAYRSVTLSWFKHSSLFALIKELTDKNVKIIITTDHGTKKVNKPIKVIADKKTSKNLRYKNGKNLNFKDKEVFVINNPESIHLPKTHLSTKYIFATDYSYLVYPNNYNYYAKYYNNTFQHGGISMEEMLTPFVQLSANK